MQAIDCANLGQGLAWIPSDKMTSTGPFQLQVRRFPRWTNCCSHPWKGAENVPTRALFGRAECRQWAGSPWTVSFTPTGRTILGGCSFIPGQVRILYLHKNEELFPSSIAGTQRPLPGVLRVKVNKREAILGSDPPLLLAAYWKHLTTCRRTTPSLKGMTNSHLHVWSWSNIPNYHLSPLASPPAQLNFPSRPLLYIYSKSGSSSGLLALAGYSPPLGFFPN
jgi:hypothetical protein